jgi:hypothetical protein
MPARLIAVMQLEESVLFLTGNCAAQPPRPKLAGFFLHKGLVTVPLASEHATVPLRLLL